MGWRVALRVAPVLEIGAAGRSRHWILEIGGAGLEGARGSLRALLTAGGAALGWDEFLARFIKANGVAVEAAGRRGA